MPSSWRGHRAHYCETCGRVSVGIAPTGFTPRGSLNASSSSQSLGPLVPGSDFPQRRRRLTLALVQAMAPSGRKAAAIH